VLYLNLAIPVNLKIHILIDKLFSQEILNARLRKKFYFNFLFYDAVPICVHKFLKYIGIPDDVCLPKEYKADPINGTLLEEILNIIIDNGFTDEALYHFKKRYKLYSGESPHKSMTVKLNNLFTSNNKKTLTSMREVSESVMRSPLPRPALIRAGSLDKSIRNNV
jgi:hypothetical protein